MHKTLSEWCLWQFEDELPANIPLLIDTQDIYDTLEWTDSRIIWHYDITAVLKYIENNRIEKSWYDRYDYFTYTKYLIQFWKREEWFDAIPNKPLHLYSEQEEKDLLELLLKIK